MPGERRTHTNPTSDKSPAKLRLAFEASPFGLLVEKAGGKVTLTAVAKDAAE